MDCLAIFCLANLFMKGELGIQDTYDPPPEGYTYWYEPNQTSPYLGAFSIGFEGDFSRKWAGSFYYRHESMPLLPDTGQDVLWVSVTWRPFR